MLTVETWAEIRRLHFVEKLSKRAIARRLGIHRATVTRALASQLLPAYTRAPQPSLLDPYKPRIQSLLEVYPELSGVRIRELLQAEGYRGGRTIVNDYLREVRGMRRSHPVYQQTVYAPGAFGQIDWAQMPDRVPYAGEWRTVYAFLMTLCYSRMLYVEFTLSCRTEDFLRAHRRALEYLGGSPRTCVYDNLRTVVARRRGREVVFTPQILAFAGTYHFAPYACWPAMPHQKELVERPVDFVKRNFWAGRAFRDFTEIAPAAQPWLTQANQRIHGTTRRRPCELWEEERGALLPLPEVPYDTDVVLRVPIRRWGHCVRFDTNDYSLPATCAQHSHWITLRADDRQVRCYDDAHCVATHTRCWARHRQVVDPAHAQTLRPQRPAARYAQLEQAFLTRYGEPGRAFYLGLGTKTERLEQHLQTILRLETAASPAAITAALTQATAAGTFDAAAVAYLLYRAADPARPAPAAVPPSPAIDVPTRDLRTYDVLAEGAS
jgi:transposase